MSKERRTVSLEADVDAYLGQDSVNASALVNSLVKEYMNGGGSTDGLQELRMRQVRSEYEDAAARARRKIEELNELRERAESSPEVDSARREDLLDKVRQVPREPDHPLVQQAAEELGMDPSALLSEVYEG